MNLVILEDSNPTHSNDSHASVHLQKLASQTSNVCHGKASEMAWRMATVFSATLNLKTFPPQTQ